MSDTGYYNTPVDFWLAKAIKDIQINDRVKLSIARKGKDLLKFGRNDLVGTSAATIAHQPAGILHETYPTTNSINTIISTAAGDTEEVVIEGHTVSGGNFTFVTQTLNLTGQTAKALTTPLARVSRFYNNDSTELTGVISITETDTYTAGVPDTAAKVHLQVDAGQQNSEKAATTISNSDYWIVTSIYGDLLKKTAGFAEVDLQVRKKGGVFRTVIDIACSDGSRAEHNFKPYLIIPSNADVRLVSLASAASTDVSGGIQGVLAKVI